MTVPTWPADLPRPERDTWGNQLQDPRQRRRSETGPIAFRRRFSSASKLVTLSVVLSRDEKSIFDTFFDQDTRKGVLPFWMPDPTTDGWPMLASSGAQLLISGGPNDGLPILLGKTWLCTFGQEMPRESIVGVEFRYSFNVAVIP